MSAAKGDTSASRQVRRVFEFQWARWGAEERLFGQTDAEMAARLSGAYTSGALRPQDYEGTLVLDAGCGHGRYVAGFRGLGARVVAMDFGSGVEQVAARHRADAGVQVVMGDVSAPPFAADSFDHVFCFGVLQFTPSPREAFLRLARCVKPGGSLYVWVYPKGSPAWEVSQRAIRAVTTRLPPRLLYALCFVPVPLLSVVPTYSGTSLKSSTWRQCAQVVWDWYSPRYQWHATADEVRGWYAEAGFEPPTLLEVQIGAIGRKRKG